MGQLVLGVAGAVAGGAIGGPTGAQLGWAIGSAIGGALAKPQSVKQSQPLIDLKVVGTEYGQPIPYLRGTMRMAGQLWWNTDRRAITTSETTETGGKGGGGTEVTTESTVYEIDALFGLTSNEIIGISRIWDEGKLIFDGVLSPIGTDIEAPNGEWTRMTGLYRRVRSIARSDL